MKLCVIDFETFWSETHTLKRMSPVEYCMHPETELQFMSVKTQGRSAQVYVGEPEIREAAADTDWSDVLAVGHNMSAFDAMLMAWRLGIRPAMWGCTLAMARPLHSKTVGLSLAKLVQHYGIGTKDNRALIQTRGRKLADFTAQEIADMRAYNADDDEQCAALFHKLKVHFTPAELWHIDCNIRMLVEPRFDLDTGLLETALSVERSNKHKALLDLAKLLRPRLELEPCYDGADSPDFAADEHREFWSDEAGVAEWVREQMASAPKFSAVLESRGVEVPLKYSKTDPEKQIPAIAKTDEAMEELLEHDDEVVATAARARLSAKSTQLETRIQSFLKTYNVVGKLPVPAHYCGADTTGRDSGFMYNMLNLPRINPDKPKVSDALRNSVRAPKGKVILVRDLSGIELRVNHTLWKVQRSMDGWSAKPDWDLYRDTAAHMYGTAASEVLKPQRHYAKVLELACGYQQGADTFRQTARIQGGLKLTAPQSAQGVKFWRDRYPEIADRDRGGWRVCHDALAYIERGDKVPIDPWGLCTTEQDAIVLASGRRIRYPGLRQEWVENYRVVNGERIKKRERVWVYGEGRHRAFIYGGKVDENCVAGDALVLTDSGWVRLDQISARHMVHDGEQFVRHGGIVCKSVQECVIVDGVRMTADHEVLTDEGWKPALEKPRPWRPDLRGVDRDAPRVERRTEDVLAVSVPVRDPVREDGYRRYQGGQARGNSELRLLDRAADPGEARDARHGAAPGVRRLGQHAGAVLAAIAQGVERLRGAGHQSLQTLARFVRGLLGGYARGVCAGLDAGPRRQRRPVLAEELPVGHVQGAGAEPARRAPGGGCAAACCRDRHPAVDAVLPTAAQPAACAVYDILNCGPLHRFVVRGTEGPFVVHNCVQAMARDVIFPQAIEFWKRTKLRPVHKVYDELVYVVDPSVADELSEMLGEIMRVPPPYWPELVLWSEGSYAETYGACK